MAKRAVTTDNKEVLKKMRQLHLDGLTKVEICRALKLSMPQVSLALSQMTTFGYFDPSACKKVVEDRYRLRVGQVRNFSLDTLTYALKNLIQQIAEMPENKLRKEALKQELIEIEMIELKRVRKHAQACKEAKEKKKSLPLLAELTEKQHRRALEIEAELEYYAESDVKVGSKDVLALTAALVKLHEIEKEVNTDKVDTDTIEGEATLAGMTLVEARKIINSDPTMQEQVKRAEASLEKGVDLEEEFLDGFDEFNKG